MAVSGAQLGVLAPHARSCHARTPGTHARSGEKPVGRNAYQNDRALYAAKRLDFGCIDVRRIKCIHGLREHKIAVGVEARIEFVSLMVEVACDIEPFFKRTERIFPFARAAVAIARAAAPLIE